jgi:hypothetical protein
VAWFWEKKPTSSVPGTLIFKVYRGNRLDDSPVLVEPEAGRLVRVGLVLWMPSMGHGSSPTRVDRVDVGTYRASDVFFIMPGEWDLRFQFSEDNQVIDEAVAQIRI